jgi:hypothetical protein
MSFVLHSAYNSLLFDWTNMYGVGDHVRASVVIAHVVNRAMNVA